MAKWQAQALLWKGRFILKTTIFTGHVSFREFLWFVLSSASYFIASGSECGGTGYHLLWQKVPLDFGVSIATYLEDPMHAHLGRLQPAKCTIEQ